MLAQGVPGLEKTAAERRYIRRKEKDACAALLLLPSWSALIILSYLTYLLSFFLSLTFSLLFYFPYYLHEPGVFVPGPFSLLPSHSDPGSSSPGRV